MKSGRIALLQSGNRGDLLLLQQDVGLLVARTAALGPAARANGIAAAARAAYGEAP